jgi:hypothetical protein
MSVKVPPRLSSSPSPQQGQGDAVGQQLGVQVDEAQGDQGPQEDQGSDAAIPNPKCQCRKAGQHGAEELDQRVADADRPAAMAAAAPEQHVAENGQVLEGADEDGRNGGSASRVWRD